ncbi:MAG: SusD/RagB family nutrient-binding outer membrane lipoprotein [Chitinophagaceae bacterium]
MITRQEEDLSNALEQINTQYWVSSFMNGSETWANFRRSGFPALTKNPFPSGDISGNFIRRMPYPDAETIVNKANLDAAVAAQGPNDLNTPVWWDK